MEFDCNVSDLQTNSFPQTRHWVEKAQRQAQDLTLQKWLDIIRGQYAPRAVESLKAGTRPPFPYADAAPAAVPSALGSAFLPKVAACHAMANLLAETFTNYLLARIPGRCRLWRVGRDRPG